VSEHDLTRDNNKKFKKFKKSESDM